MLMPTRRTNSPASYRALLREYRLLVSQPKVVPALCLYHRREGISMDFLLRMAAIIVANLFTNSPLRQSVPAAGDGMQLILGVYGGSATSL